MKTQITLLMDKIICTISNKNNYSRTLCKEIGSTDSGIIACIHRLEKEKIIIRTEKGRKKIITLTKKGLKLKSLLEEIKKL